MDTPQLPEPDAPVKKPPQTMTGSLTKEFYKTKELTQILGVNKDTLNRWVRKGYLVAHRLPGSVGHIFRVEHINEFLKSYETRKPHR